MWMVTIVSVYRRESTLLGVDLQDLVGLRVLIHVLSSGV